MLLALVFVYQIAAITASPISQYPFALLLNVGNEEVDNVNTERIKISQPGGSVALRYPAFGFGDTITNVKVIGVLLKDNIKAEIVEGGPGSNYVVLALLGDEVPYDVLLVLQTASDTVNVYENVKFVQNDSGDPYGVGLDKNDSAEDLSDDGPPNYTKNDDNDENEVNNNAQENDENDTDDDPAYATPDIHRPTPDQFPDDNTSLKTSVSLSQSPPKYADLIAVDKYSNDIYDEPKVNVKYISEPKGETSHAYYDNAIQQKDNYNKYDQKNGNDEYEDNQNEIDQMFNDEEVHDKYPASNNNNNKIDFDADDSYAVDY